MSMRTVLLFSVSLLPGLMLPLPAVASRDDYRPAQAPGSNLVRRLFGENRVYFRLGASYLDPDLKTRSITLDNLSNIAGVALEPGPQQGDAYADPLLLPGAIIGYRLPWGQGWSLETLIGAPPSLEVKLKGEIADEPLVEEAQGIPTGVPPLGNDAIRTKALPPVITLVKRFREGYSLRPYVGLGATYLYTYDTRVNNRILTEVGHPDVEIKNRFGWVAQAGLDMRLSRQWWAALDLKYIGVPDVVGTMRRAHIRAPGLPQYEFIEVGDARFVADMELFAVHLGFGFTF